MLSWSSKPELLHEALNVLVHAPMEEFQAFPANRALLFRPEARFVVPLSR